MKKLLSVFLLMLCFVPSIYAVALGVNKVSLEYHDVLRSGYAEDYVVVTTGSVENISLYYEAQGSIKDWITFSPSPNESLTMNINSPGVIKIMVKPPIDARSGNYSGVVLVATGPLATQEGKIGTNVEVAFELEVSVNVTDTEILACTAGGYDIKDAEIGFPLEFSASVADSGNVRVAPSFSIKITSQNQKKLMEVINYSSQSEILPTMTGDIRAKLEHQLDVGQYWAEIESYPCGTQGTLTFSILEKGGISDVGEFVRLENNAWSKTGEIVPITAHFKNRGTREVTAQFKGIVTLNEKIVKVISSDKIDVAPGELAMLETFYEPSEIGQYKISGRITYNNKLTYEKSSMLNVEEGLAKEKRINIYYTALAFIIVAIVLLLFLIRKKKSRKKA